MTNVYVYDAYGNVDTMTHFQLNDNSGIHIYGDQKILYVAKDLASPNSFLEYVVVWRSSRDGGVYIAKVNRKGKSSDRKQLIVDLNHGPIDMSLYVGEFLEETGATHER